jgi:hypothetical protein
MDKKTQNFEVYVDQVQLLKKDLLSYEPNIHFIRERGNMLKHQPNNWFFSFLPSLCKKAEYLCKGKSLEMGFTFMCLSNRDTGIYEIIRFSFGVGKENREQFYEDCLAALVDNNVIFSSFSHNEIYPNANTLLLAKRFLIDNTSHKKAFDLYKSLNAFVPVVANVMTDYYRNQK